MLRQLFTTATLVFTLGLSAAAPTQGQANPWHEGTVVSAAGNRLQLTGSRGVRRIDRLNAATQVFVNGRPARLSALRPGVRVKVFLNDLGEVAIVETTTTSP